MTTGLLAAHLGTDVLTVAVSGESLTGQHVGPVSIRRGRDRPGDRFPPATCTLSVVLDDLTGGLPALGELLTVDLSDDTLDAVGYGWTDSQREQARRRFTGHLSDIDVTEHHNDARTVVTLTAVSPLARLRAALVTPYFLGELFNTTATDGQTAQVVVEYALVQNPSLTASSVGTFQGGYFDLNSYAELHGNSYLTGALLDRISENSLGELVELRDGTLAWRDGAQRGYRSLQELMHDTATEVLLQEVLVGSSRSLTAAGLTNEWTVTLGGGTSATATDATSVATYGRQPAELTADLLLDVTDAQTLADALLDRTALPRWEYGARVVDVVRTLTRALGPVPVGSWSAQTGSWSDVDPDTVWGGRPADLLLADLDDVLRVEGLAKPQFLDGWTETISRDAWRLALTLNPDS